MIINDWYVWRLRKKPSKIRPYRIMVSTPPSHGGNRGSNPLRVTTSQQTMLHSKIPLIWVGFFHMLRCCSLSQKGHARLACSVVNALATARGRYHLFASAPAARLKLLLLLHFWLSPVRALAPRRGKSFWLAAFSCEKTASLFGLPILFPKKSRLLRKPLWARA